MTRKIDIGRPGRRRSEESQQAILEAALAILEEEGLPAFNIEKVAARAGAAKTTIYRWWPSKGALAIDSFLTAVAPQIAFPKAASVIDAIRAQIHLVGRAFRGPNGRTLSMILAVAQSDPATRKAYLARYVTPRREDALKMLVEGIRRGELRDDLDLEATVDAIYGPIYYRLVVQHGPISDEWLDAIFDTVLAGIRRAGPDQVSHTPKTKRPRRGSTP